MKSGLILMFILLATASPTGQSVSQSSHALDGISWPLNRLPLRSGELATREASGRVLEDYFFLKTALRRRLLVTVCL